MSKKAGIAPWSHHNARQWFEALLSKSRFIDHVETVCEKRDSGLDIPRARVFASVLIMLGRPGIWPDKHADLLHSVTKKLDRVLKNPAPNVKSKTPLSLDEHRIRGLHSQAFEFELEMLKRRTGISVRKSVLRKPPSWKMFWN